MLCLFLHCILIYNKNTSPFIIHCTVYGHIDCFQFFAFMSNAECCYEHVCICLLIAHTHMFLLGIFLGAELLGHRYLYMHLISIANTKVFPLLVEPTYILCCSTSFSFFFFFNTYHFSGCVVVCHCDLH